MGVLTQYENDITSGIDSDLISLINKIGTDTLDTTAQTLSGAVNEHENDISGLNTKVGSATLDTESQNLSGAVNELNYDISDIYTTLSGIINLIYPVGSYYETTDTTFNPNTIWTGTTWVLETEGLVHVSGGSTYTVSNQDQDGGSSTISYTPAGSNSDGAVLGHAITINEMPSHDHEQYVTANSGTIGVRKDWSADGKAAAKYDQGITTGSRGNNQAHTHGFTNPTFTGTEATLDNMQPYKIVNRWHRTA